MSASNNMSLYIPRVFMNITKQRMAQIFHSLSIGKVSSIDFVPREDNNTGDAYNMAFIHFDHYYDNVSSKNFQEKVIDTKHEAKIVYDDPWYWICLPNANPKPDAVRELERRVSELEEWIRYYNSLPNCGIPEPLSSLGSESVDNFESHCEYHNLDLPPFEDELLPPAAPEGYLQRSSSISGLAIPRSKSPDMNSLEAGLGRSNGREIEELVEENYDAEINAYAYDFDNESQKKHFKPPLELPLTEGQIEKDDSGKLYKFKLENNSPKWIEIPNYTAEWGEANKKYLETHS